ncbi:D-ribose pyranase [Suttonella ornithocola]|uniref:D-ribose pyranase n=1 Tax=Suttonella ornithocola TaxID=279832 RepID=A0A380MT11_9GAMM|nr:D-ribose pyranase [Suttonella ornithocola]
MKTGVLLNASISAVIASMGHTDAIAIADAGLPIPSGPERIDLALRQGIPSFMDVLQAVLTEVCIERVVLASEIQSKNPEIHQKILALLKKHNIQIIEYVSHEAFKRLTQTSKAVVRTGECTPYANILLYSGVVF